jgi:pimeloyl-ACP methyl ester carboxylesterase
LGFQPSLLIGGLESAPRTPRAYLRDVPDAELHLFDTGHFALEDRLREIAPLIADFLDRTWT